MASNIEESRASIDTDSKDLEKAPETTTANHGEEEVFPGWRKVAIVMVAIYLAMFLVALVRLPIIKIMQILTTTGPHDLRNSYSEDHRRFPLDRRCSLVRQCIPPYHLRLSTYIRANIYLLLTKICFIVGNCYL